MDTHDLLRDIWETAASVKFQTKNIDLMVKGFQAVGQESTARKLRTIQIGLEEDMTAIEKSISRFTDTQRAL